MPKFGSNSLNNLQECDPELQRLFIEVVKHWDCSIIDGVRTIEEQIKNVAKGVSKTLESKHLPDKITGMSNAVDVMPYPFDWNKIEAGLNALKKADAQMQVAEVYAFQGFVKGMATAMGIKIRQGIDWNGNNQFDDHSFIDLPHNELVK